MGNCMKEQKVDHEMQFSSPESPISAEPRLVQDSIAFRPDSALFDQSYAVTQSIDHLSKQLDTSRMWQEAKFQNVLSETRVLEAKLESIRQKTADFGPSLSRLASDAGNQYLDLERQLEAEMGQIREEMGKVKEEVETLNEKAKELATEEQSSQ